MAVILPPLKDRVRPPVRVLFVGINPGIRSATIGHHFAGYSNRFWKLLYESRLVDEPIGAVDDGRLVEWGYGITNLISRPTPGIDTLRPSEYPAGERLLRRKVRHWKPDIVAFVGVTLFRVLFGRRSGDPVELGSQSETFEGARVFVLPNPSGRNANFSYEEMLAAFRLLRRRIRATSHHSFGNVDRAGHRSNRAKGRRINGLTGK
jgi:TDG/mug DNA glycosylase family protein